MNDDIDNEIGRLLRIDNVKGDECIKVLAICAKVLNNSDYIVQVAKLIDGIFSQPSFDFMAEFGLVIGQLIELNKRVTFYKEVSVERMKYVLYAVFYHYAFKKRLNWLNEQNIGQIRLLYCNVYDLLMIRSESLKIAKSGCLSCVCAAVQFWKDKDTQQINI
jgi:hypothetical protein